ncbi:MAG: GNAT family N-acetyltransferase [Clostridia bacterium]|nr:GNAT family N-acetyltransferase [Clostridia bacterium]
MKMRFALETQRLLLREMEEADCAALHAVLGDETIMRHYPSAFDEKRVREWIQRNRERYRELGFGLWAVCLKDGGVIGDCGLTLQRIDGETLPEIGYHIRRDCQRLGYAKEGAAAVRDWAFEHTDFPAVYAYCKYTNLPSRRTAEAIGMRLVKEYPDEINGVTCVFALAREAWDSMKRNGG